MKRKILFLLAIGAYYTSLAQDKKFDISLKSPDAAQISKHTDMPSSTYTGISTTNIPIYNIKVDKEIFPITINYHASGVKVKEIASKVGLGWSLSIGNTSLSKQIFGEEDRGWIPNIPMAEGSFTPNDMQSNDYALAAMITGFNESNGSLDRTSTKRDTQPDIFSYSVNGISGEFHYDHTGKIIQIPYQKVKIENIFKITDDKGVVYNFIAGNSVRNMGGSVSSPESIQVTDYIIQSIVYPSGKVISFEYEPISYGYLSNYTKIFSYPVQGCQSTSGDSAQNEYSQYATYSDVLKEFILKKIIFPDGEIDFNYDNREDILNGKKISNIKIKDKNQRVIQNYLFNQSYFTSTEQIDVLNYSNQTASLMKRLKLNEVVETLENKKYQFEYNEDSPLANRFSNATDYLGFYNGQNSNTGIEYVEYANQIYGLGDNKEPNINFAKQGLLKKMKYPTGGIMEFEYENDSYHFNGYEKKINRNELFVQNSDAIQTMNTQTTLNQINFKVEFNSTVNPSDDGSGSLPVGAHFIGEILNSNNIVVKTFLITGSYDFLLPAQSGYKVRIRKSSNIPNSEYANLYLEWFNIENELKDYDKNIGGIRIKRVIKKESGNSNTLIQNYKYLSENNRTSGEYFGDKIHYYYVTASPFGVNGNSCSRLIISNSGNFNIATINGKPIAYNRVVTEIENGQTAEKYKTIDYFTNYPSSNFNNEGVSFLSYANNQYARGIINKKEFYDSSNRLLEKQDFGYDFDYKLNEQSSDYVSSTPELTVQPYVLSLISITYDAPTTFPYYKAAFNYERYSINSSWVKLKSQKTTRYFGNQSKEEISNYTYDNLYRHLNPTSLAVDFSDGSIQKTSYSYAHEKGNQLMIDKNMIGIPLETSTAQTIGVVTKTLGKTETIYPVNQSEANTKSSGLVLPLSVKSYDLQNTPSTEVTYDLYDSKGNLQQYTTKDGVPLAIIWGYNNTQPIAKIEGATYAQVSSLASAIVSTSDTDAQAGANNDETALLDALKNFKNSLPNYQITTYTYDLLIGVRSITPPSGIRENYIYDSAGRLEKVINMDGKVLKEMKYNYKN
ncbi:hypothetical protein BOQ62_03300 [Chryseobacterium sp. CH21]|uniref:hypothetical protein n=1 Tax=Chryseobacterium sp. CH21 TaxID=713556 RepID=UPI00100AA2D7|nr:hypothetical protein [Chryseobacterium sp. CH21]RXM41071.1 hypothetical protein BOQ62_03300 [Chryseobacterium sp. CH21]